MRRLKTLAAIINTCDCCVAEIVPGFSNTDRKIGRLRHAGKGRRGNRLIVKDLTGRVVLDHNSAETYRSNSEVEAWIVLHGI